MALSQTQRTKAVIDAAAPNDIVTHNLVKIDPLAPSGVSAAELQPSQRELLMHVIDAYASAIIEFDNTQNDGNHIHSVWRDFNGDFGRDLLREHVAGVAHYDFYFVSL